jgi:hypothetical protein
VSAPILTKTWNITPNLRRPYTTLADSMGWFFYQNKVAMLASGWTIKFTCGFDGISTYTGPSSGADTTDRWTTSLAATGRGTAANTDQSWAVLQNSDGLQVLFAFQGATDDIGRITFSPGGLFTLATPSTNQPTATDETFVSTGNSLVSATTNSDRVMTIWCTSDSTQWSCLLNRAGSIVNYLGCEKIISYCGTGVFTVPYVGFRYTIMYMANNPNSGTGFTPCAIINNTASNATGFLGTSARVFTASASRLCRIGGGAICVANVADGFTRTYNDRFFAANYPGLQGSRTAPCHPIFWCGEKSANLDGIIGSPRDWWICLGASGGFPTAGNFLPGYDVGDTIGVTPVRTNWLVALGTECVRPWKDAAAALLFS